jgi:hypothetical protein
MRPTKLRHAPSCTARSLNEIGDQWTLLIARDAFYGACRVGRFQRRLGVSKKIWSVGLRKMAADGNLEMRPAAQWLCPPRISPHRNRGWNASNPRFHRSGSPGRDGTTVITRVLVWIRSHNLIDHVRDITRPAFPTPSCGSRCGLRREA